MNDSTESDDLLTDLDVLTETAEPEAGSPEIESDEPGAGESSGAPAEEPNDTANSDEEEEGEEPQEEVANAEEPSVVEVVGPAGTETEEPASPDELTETTGKETSEAETSVSEEDLSEGSATRDGGDDSSDESSSPSSRANDQDEPDGQGRGTNSITLERNTAGEITVANNIYQQQQVVDDRDGFFPVAPEEWSELEPLFVPSESCRVQKPDLEKGRLLAILGPEHSGKRATALFVAAQLDFLGCEHSDVMIYRPASHTRRVSLHDLVNREEFSSGSLLLFEDAFGVGVSPSEVESFHSLQSQLRENESFLILTSELHSRDLVEGIQRVSAQLSAKQLKKVLRLALDQGLPSQITEPAPEEIRGWIDRSWPALVRTLDAPFKIHRFCRRLIERLSQPPPLRSEELKRLAHEAIDPGPALLRSWFQRLERDVQLLGFLVVFFPDLFRSDLISLYRHLVGWLRQSEPTLLQDPRHHGFEDMLNDLQAQTKNQLIQMEATHYQREVKRQVANHFMMLRTVAESMLDQLRLLRGHDSWPLRKGLGQLIGQLGLQDWEWLRSTIKRLAQHEDWQYRTIASYALAPIVTIDLERRTTRVVELLRDWSQSQDQNLRWTAGSGIWQVYRQVMGQQGRAFHQAHLQGVKDRLLDFLRLLSISRQDSSLFAMVHILRSFSEETAPMLAERMVDDKTWRGLVSEAMKEVLQTPMAAYLPALPHLFGALLASASPTGDRSRRIFETLRKWLFRDDLADEVLFCLLEVAHRASTQQRSRLRQALSRSWHVQDRSRETASRIIARTWALDGRWNCLSPDTACLLVLDSRGWGSPAYREICSHIQLILGVRMNLRIAELGRVETRALGAPLPARAGGQLGPQLLLPLLEEVCQTPRTWNVVVLAAGPILDLDDLAGRADPSILLLAFGDQSQSSQHGLCSFPGTVEYLGGSASGHNRRKVEETLDALLWGAEAASESAGLDRAELTASSVAEVLSQLNDPDGAAASKDALGELSARLLHLSRHDLDAALTSLSEWYAGSRVESEEGAAGKGRLVEDDLAAARVLSKILLRDSIHRFRREGAFPSTRLFDQVMVKLTKCEPDSGELVRELLLICLNSPEWAEYLAGDVVDGRGRLARFLLTTLPGELPRVTKLLSEQTLAIWNPLQDQFAKIVRTSVPKETLPTLGEGQKRALIFVDNDAGESLWKTAAEVGRSLLEPDSPPELVPSMFQLGLARPVWVPGSSWEPGTTPANPPRMLGPTLESPDIRLEETAFVLVLTDGAAIDQDDWRHSSWAERIWGYSGNKKSPVRAGGGDWPFLKLAPPASTAPKRLANDLVDQLGTRAFGSIRSMCRNGTNHPS